MLSGKHNYNETLMKVITVFGSLFNNIYIGRKQGEKVTNVQRVPISFGPSKKFMARIKADALNKGQKVGIQLPRISFDLVSLNYSAEKQLNKLNRNFTGDCESGLKETSRWEEVPYELAITLSIYGNSQDDVFQILEQILPLFSPSYTVTVKGLVAPESLSDVPFTLQGVNIEDSYEGDFVTRRAIIHTLDFACRIAFSGPQKDIGVIETVDVNAFLKDSDIESDTFPVEPTVPLTYDEK